MDYRYIHFIILACVFTVLGILFFKLAREDRRPREETVVDGTITYVVYTDNGNGRVHVELTYDGELYPDLVILCQKWPGPNPALEGKQVKVACYRNKDGILKGRILDDGFEPLTVSYLLPVLFLTFGVLSAFAAVYFFIKTH